MNMKDIVKEYFENWTVGRFSKMRLNESSTFLIVYMWVMYMFNVMDVLNTQINRREALMGLVMLISGTLVYFSMIQHPLQHEKIFYLCPMNHEERKKYIWNTYFFRCAAHIILFTFGTVIMMPFSSFKPLMYPVILLNNVVISMIVPINNKTEKGYCYILFLVLTTVLSNMAAIEVLADSKNSDMWMQIILICVLIFITLPLMVGFSKHIKRKLNEAVDYETNGVRQ
ncbi:hypothetical protein ACTNBM_09740 [Lachnospiraceae bacterium HCP1S3_C3]|nr:hypothetical protein [Lachnospiraceae bacterium]